MAGLGLTNTSVLAKVGVHIYADTVDFKNNLKAAEIQLGSFKNVLASTFSQIAAGFTIYEVGRQIINVTSQFERFEAVLSNTLGSNSQAQAALDEIAQFAKNTPYQISEVTAAYVRWANLGLDPNIKKMRMLGDVAASLGAGFEQTAEAFKDLMVGQTKRIEEIGISAVQQNGKIQLSFKGLNLEIEKSAEGVLKALEAFSQMNGVLGTQDEISKTLTGRISNLKDSWDIFLKTIGEKGSPVLKFVIEQLTDVLDIATNLRAQTSLDVTNLGLNALKGLKPEDLDWILKYGRTFGGFGKNIGEELKSIYDVPIKDQFLKLAEYNEKVRQTLVNLGVPLESAAILVRRYADNVTAAYYSEKNREATAKVNAALTAINAQNAKDQEDAEKKLNEQKDYQKYLEERAISRKEYLATLAKLEIENAKKQAEQQARLNKAISEYNQLRAIPSVKEKFGDKIEKPSFITPEYLAGLNQATDAVNKTNEAFKNAVTDGMRSFLDGLQAVGQGQITFGENILRAVAVFAKQFGEYMLATAITALNVKKMFEAGGLFAGTGGALLAIGSAAALIALAGAGIGAMSKKSSSSASMGITNGLNNRLEITGTLVGNGRDLIAVINNTNFDNKYRRGG